MFSCPRCSSRFEASAVPSALVCPRCRDQDGVFAPLTFWLFDPRRRDDESAGPVRKAAGKRARA